jgi:DNA-binding LytR/AlgR family response regulator
MVKRPLVILITAFSEYAVKGFDLAVTDFLLKPYGFDRFNLAVSKAADYIRWQQIGLAALQAPLDYIFIKSGYKLVKIILDDILYVEGLRDYQHIVTKTEKVIASHSIHELEKLLPKSMIRCHKSYIVSLGKINSIERNRIKIGNKYIPIGEAYKEDFYSRI